MEPSKIDKLISERLKESINIHDKEIASSKPFVWSSIQHEVRERSGPSWYHFAAACVAIILAFYVLFIHTRNTQEVHTQNLISQIETLKLSHLKQGEMTKLKQAQIDSLSNELALINERMADLQSQPQKAVETIIVHRIDTLIVSKTEYIVKEIPMETFKLETSDSIFSESKKSMEQEVSDEIFLTSSNQKTKRSESLRVQFGPFSSRN